MENQQSSHEVFLQSSPALEHGVVDFILQAEFERVGS